MAEFPVVTTDAVVVEAQWSFTLVTLCRATGAEPGQVQTLVDEGLLQPTGPQATDWRFGGEALAQTRRALRLARDLDLRLPDVALVIDLLAEIERLRARLRQP